MKDAVDGSLTADALIDDAANTAIVSGTSTDVAAGTIVNVTLTDSAGTTAVGTATVGADGSYTTIAIDTSGLLDGTITTSVTATDNNGNPLTATDTDVKDTAEIIAAADNFVDLVLTATPEITTKAPYSNTTFDVVTVGLGPILSAGVLDQLGNNALRFDVGENEVREVTMNGNAGGINVGATYDLFYYKLNESTNQYEQQGVEKNWVVAYLLGGVGKDTEFNLTEGKWVFVMAPGEGVAALSGYSIVVTEDNTLDYNSATNVSGTTSGNVLTDDDITFGVDQLPAGTTLTSVNGQPVSATGSTVIEGQYGNLTIGANGAYNYVLKPGFTAEFGSEESFTYVVTSPLGNTASADLTIQLNILPSLDQRIEIDETIIVNAEPTIIHDATNVGITNVGSFKLVGLDFLGPVLGADILGGTGTMKFKVGENQLRELTFKGAGGGLSFGAEHDLAIYKLNEETGQYVQVHFEDNWFTTVAFGSSSKNLTLDFSEGTYRAILVGNGGLNILTGSSLSVVGDKLVDYDAPLNFTGSISADATEDATVVVLAVDGQPVEVGQATTIQGDYGTLVIKSDGTHTYTVDKPANAGPDWKPPYGKVDSFQLVIKDADGNSTVDKLNIKISTHTATDDVNGISVTEQNLVTTTKIIDGVSAATRELSKDFTIDENTQASATLKVGTTTAATRLEYSIVNKDTGEVVATNAGEPARTLSVIIDVLPPGNYTIQIERVRGLGHLKINDSDFTIETIYFDKYVSTTPVEVNGDLLANDTSLSTDIISELKVGGLNVFVSDPNKGADSIQVDGQYGTLTVFKDGSYKYVPDGGVYGIETFTYETTSIVGVKENATLTINVGKTITASINNDVVISSAADDTYVMGAGADTVIFTNLGGTKGGNGSNGLDTWSDFNAVQGDKIDVSGLLDGNQNATNIGDYLKYEDGVLMVDRNGNSEFEELLNVSATDLDTLLGSIEWQAAGGMFARFSMESEDSIDLPETSMLISDEGFDVLSFEGTNQVISLADIMQPDIIDISGIGANILNIAAEDINSAIYVQGDSDDTVNLEGDGWSNVEQTTLGTDIYNAWQLGEDVSTQIYIDTNITNVI